MSLSSQLNKDGFILLKNIIPQNIIYKIRNQITKTSVNYNETHAYTNLLMNYASQALGTQMSCTKYRVSNNNNSSDAASFHRDLQIHKSNAMNGKMNGYTPNVFTILSYLDNTVMQLIPGSHIKSSTTLLGAIKQFKSYVELEINPGDILIFYATTIHRGIFYKKQENRRLVQCFDCIPKNEIKKISKQILHLPCYPYCSKELRDLLASASKIKMLIEPINYINYLNVSCGYGCQFNILDKYGYTELSYISTESNNQRLKPKLDNSFEIINRYIILSDIIDAKPLDSYKLKQDYALKNFKYFFTIVFIICIIITFLTIFLIPKK
jgi:hypothetical protein